jgi:hypothetical protein
MDGKSIKEGTPGWLRFALRVIALALGAAHTAVAIIQQSINEDGIGYLDMGAAYLRGDWEMAVNGIWSPLYSWILGAVIYIFEPSIHWEFPAAQLTNFIIYAIALVSFEYFWRELTARCHRQVGNETGQLQIHPVAWLLLGYSLFIWCALVLVQIWAVTPDMTIAALVFIAAGLVLRLSGPKATSAVAVMLGIVLGLGYLAKAAMMPLGIACLLLTLAIPAEPLGRLKRLILSTAGFFVVSAPFMFALSVEKGSPTFGDVGRFTYLKHVNEMSYPNFYTDLDRLDGEPEHPPRQIIDQPPVYEFAEPIGGTYPMAYDPGYWTDGLKPSVSISQQVRALVTNGMIYFELFFRQQGAFLAVMAVLLAMSFATPLRLRLIGPEIALLSWALAALGLYSLVFVTARYIAPFVVLFWAALLAVVRLPDTKYGRRLLQTGSALLIAFVWVNIGTQNLEGLAGVTGFTPMSESVAPRGQFSDGHHGDNPAIAEGLLANGLEKGDKVGFLGYSYSAYWARLARLKIVAEIYPEHLPTFWQLDALRQTEVLQSFAGSGARAVISEPVGADPTPPGWVPIGQTGYLLYFIR